MDILEPPLSAGGHPQFFSVSSFKVQRAERWVKAGWEAGSIKNAGKLESWEARRLEA